MQSACGQSLPPSFRAAREYFGAKKLLSARFSCRARQCFCCKEVVIAHGRVARPLSMKLCLKKSIFQRRTRQKSHPLRMITDPKECRTEIFRQICARTSQFSLTNHRERTRRSYNYM